MSGRRVLIVDDSVDSRESMAIFFEIEGFEVHIARDGAEGIAAVSDYKPTVVFMDIQMPNMDGYEAARRIRASPDGIVPKLVAITGWTRDEDKKRAEEAGFDHVIYKPASPAGLREILAKLFPGSDEKGPANGDSRTCKEE